VRSNPYSSYSLSKNDTSATLSVSLKDRKYVLHQKPHTTQQQDIPTKATEHSQQNDPSNPKQTNNDNLTNTSNNTVITINNPIPPTKPTLLTLPTEIRLMIYTHAFATLTETSLDRAATYPLPPLLRTHPVLRNEALQEWGSHLETVVTQHKSVLATNQKERGMLLAEQRFNQNNNNVGGNVFHNGGFNGNGNLLRRRRDNAIKSAALLSAIAGQSKTVVKRLDKLRLLQAHQMLAESGVALGENGSGGRWRDGRV
jgi:hypothetical protein